MTGELLPPRFCGLRLALKGPDAALLFGRILGLEAAPRLHLGPQWIEVNAESSDALELRCDDLNTRRNHLRRLGIEAIDGSASDATTILRLDAVDTGACAVDLSAGTAASIRQPSPWDAGARLCALELTVRAPERIALHWGQMFSAPTSRDSNGLPMLSLDGVDLRFAAPEEGRLGVTALDFATATLEAWASRASAQGLSVDYHADRAAFTMLGIAFRLRGF